jgi:phosphonate transport system ATP-binding protein
VSAAAIELLQLRWEAGGRRLLDIPSLRVEPGERVAVIGPNGAGKSSLLRILTGLVRPTAGEVWVLGRPLHQGLDASDWRCLRAEVGLVHQGLHLVPRLTARENVLIGALAHPLPRWRSWSRLYPLAWVTEADAALARFGVAECAELRADRLSGGERQKVALARLLMQRSRLVLADEPTAALDPSSAALACEGLRSAPRDGTLLAVVHQAELLSLLADRVIALCDGRVAWDRPRAAINAKALADLYRSAQPVATRPERATRYPSRTERSRD